MSKKDITNEHMSSVMFHYSQISSHIRNALHILSRIPNFYDQNQTSSNFANLYFDHTFLADDLPSIVCIKIYVISDYVWKKSVFLSKLYLVFTKKA